MSVQNDQAATRLVHSDRRPLSRALSEAFLRRTLRGLAFGQLTVDTPAGERLVFDGQKPGIQARLVIHNWRFLLRLAVSADVGFAEGYIAGEWSSPNLTALIRFADENEAALTSLDQPRPWLKLRHWLNRNTRRGSRRNIAAHYDLGNSFYGQWLDAGMSYSSAMYSSAVQSLEDAQNEKLDRVIDLLGVSGGERVLEIGCGWGGLAERMLERRYCTVTGLTLSSEQLAFVRKRFDDRGLLGRGEVRLQDYRDVGGQFDRIVSIEMLEAVGESYWPKYFQTLWDRLVPGGAAVLQVITIDDARFHLYRRRPDFIQKYIFPGGMLPTVSIIGEQAARAGLRLVSSELFGASYARTLEEWQRRFQANWPRIQELGFDERFKRTWDYYISYCQSGFETGALDVGLYKLVR
ncbi:MAG: cyclopropane-fatty-acyl-phospholipid synthase family protein [Hyphomicrobiales bacterium]|nr:cyclopropane-fatty-acyl-phospholipid synthase [Alphaproteobacteria bacterium]